MGAAESSGNVHGGTRGGGQEQRPSPRYGQRRQQQQQQEHPTCTSLSWQQRYGLIPDNFTTLQQVQSKLREVGLESSNLIVGVDFTASNAWTGKRSFRGRSLHALGEQQNPYETAISVIGETLAPFDEDGLIPCYGFGDTSTHDQAVFSFYSQDKACEGFADVLRRFRAIVPHIKLAGPTSFGPIIEQAVRIVETSGGQYHVLLIIADGQVTRGSDLPLNVLSQQERASVDAICAASNFPLSIVLVGVGDGPWEAMTAFDDALPQRNFDNFQFVNLTSIMASRGTPQQLAAKFALAALMEVPFQYKACVEMGIVGQRVGRMPPTGPLPPPPAVLAADQRRCAPSTPPQNPSAPPLASSAASSSECPVCWEKPKAMAFQCGHQACIDCGESLQRCPICRSPVALRIRLY